MNNCLIYNAVYSRKNILHFLQKYLSSDDAVKVLF